MRALRLISFKSLAAALVAALAIGALSGTAAFAATLSVTSVSPAGGGTNTTVTVTGSGFSTFAACNKVSFGSSSVTASSSTGTTVTAKAPSGTGTVDVTVSLTGGGCGSGSSAISEPADLFTYAAPTVTSLSAAQGPTAGGTSVTMSGTNFVPGSTVKFGSTTATSSVVSPTSITATSPAGSAGTVNVTVTNPIATSTSTASFQYIAQPTITAVSPRRPELPGQTGIAITGTNFASGSTTVTFGSSAATAVNVTSATSLTATVPADSGDISGHTVDVTATTAGGTSATSTADEFAYAAPTITNLGTTSGTISGGTSVAITGTNFVPGSTVSFGSTPAASATINSATSITATTPAESAGAVNVTVTNPDGTSASTATFTFGTVPTVTSISPNAGGTNSTVTITGTGFSTTLANNTVKFGSNTAASPTAGSSTSLTVKAPGGGGGATVDVTVATSIGTSPINTGDEFAYAAPTVTNLGTTSGLTSGGTSVAITGTGFVPGSTVSFGSTAAASVTINSPTSITATTPAESAGSVNVTATNPDGVSTVTQPFLFGTVPTVTSVSPDAGASTNTVTITGTGFVSGSTSVKFGSNSGTSISVSSSTSLTVRAPSENGDISGHTVDITATNPLGTSATSTGDEFAYTAPTVTSLGTNAGPPAGGTSVAITGTNFVPGSTVSFGTTPAASATINSATSITATSPAESAGSVNVTVTNPDGTSISTGTFTFGTLPTVTSISPDAGGVGGTVIITGTGFSTTAANDTVKFGTTTAVVPTAASATSLTLKIPAETGDLSGHTVDVTVTTLLGTSTTGTGDEFAYAAPTVTSLGTPSGPAIGGTPVTITGTNFVPGSTVSFGSTQAASTTAISATSIVATSPGESAGPVNVTVTNPDGTSTSVATFTFNSTNIAQISPISGTTPQGLAFTGQLQVNGTGVTFTQSSGAPNLNVSASGAISATSTLAAGTYTASGTDQDGLGDTGSWTFALAVTAPGSSLASIATLESPTTGNLASGGSLQVTFNEPVTLGSNYSLTLTDGTDEGTLSSSTNLSAVASGSGVTFTLTGAPTMSTGSSLSLTNLEILAETGVTAQSDGTAWNLVLSGQADKVDLDGPTTCTPVNTRVFGGSNCSIGFDSAGPTAPDIFDVIATPTADLVGPPEDSAPEVITNCTNGSTDTVYDLTNQTDLGSDPCGTFLPGESTIGNTTSNTLDYIPTPNLTSFEQVGVIEQMPGSLYLSATAVPVQITSINVSGATATFNYSSAIVCQSSAADSPGDPTMSQFTYASPWWSTSRDDLVYPVGIDCPTGSNSATSITVTYPSPIPTDGVRFKYEGYGEGYFVVGASNGPVSGVREASESAYVGPNSAPPNPSITSFTGPSTPQSPHGETVTVNFGISDATQCSIAVSSSAGVTVSMPYTTSTPNPALSPNAPCPDSSGSASITLPANTTGSPVTYTATLTASGLTGSTPATQTLEIVVGIPGTITVTNTTDSVNALSPYSGQLATSGNTGAVTYVTTSTGNAFTVSSTGAITAPATLVPGTYTVSGTDSDAFGNTGSWSFALTVNPAGGTISVTNTTDSVNALSPYSGQLATSGNTGAVTYVTTTGTAFSVSSAGVITAPATLVPGTYMVSGTDSDAFGNTGTWSFALTVSPAGGTISVTNTIDSVNALSPYNGQLNPSGNTGAVTYVTTSTGNAFSVSSTGVITAPATLVPGTYTVSGTDSDAFGDTGTWSFALTVNPAGGTISVINTTDSVNALSAYNGQLNPSGNTGAVTYVTTTGMAFSVSSAGVITALATLVPGTYTVSGTDSDAFGNTGSWSFALTVNPAGGAISVTNTTGSVNALSPYSGQLTSAGNTGAVIYVTTSTGNAFTVSSTGVISAPATLVPGTYMVSGTDSDAFGDTGTWSFALTVNPAGGTIIEGPPSTGTVTALDTYTGQITTSGNTGAVTYVTTSTGNAFSVSSTGAITAPATLVPGTYTVSGTDSDAFGNTGSWSFALTVNPAGGAIALTNSSGTANALSAYSGQLATSGNTGAVTYVTTSTGNAFTVSSTGVISAPATLVPGTYTVSGTDSDAFGDTGTWSFTLTVNPAGGTISVTNTIDSVNALSVYNGQLNPSGNTGAVTYVTTTGTAFSVSSAGVITALATLVPGTYTVSGTDSDAFGNTGSWSFALTVSPAGGAISVTNTTGSVNALSPYSGQLATSGNTGAVTYVTTSTGNAFSVSSTGAITAPATLVPGTYTVSGTDSDAFGDTGSWSFALTVNPAGGAISVTNTTGSVNALSPYSGQLATSGNTGAVTYVTTSTGNAFTVSSTGAITAPATLVPGTYTVSGTDSDAFGNTGTWSFALTVNPAGGAISVTNTTGSVNALSPYSGQLNPTGNIGAVTYVTTSTGNAFSVSSTGVITAPATLVPGTYTVSGTDSDAFGNTGTWSFALTVSPAGGTISVTNTIDSVNALSPYNGQLNPSGNTGAVSYVTTSTGNAFTVSSTGVITAPATLVPGTYTVSGTDSDAFGDTGTWSFTLTVNPAGGSINQGATNTTGSVNALSAYNGQLVVSGNSGAVTYVTTTGMAFSVSSAGVITAPATLKPGIYGVAGTDSDAFGDTGTWSFALTVNGTGGAITVTNTTGSVNALSDYSGQLNSTGNTGAVTYVTTSSESAFTTVSSSGAISALATLVPGTYTLSGTDSDAYGNTGTWSFTLTVNPAGGSIAQSATNTTGSVNALTTYNGQLVVSGNNGAVTFATGTGAAFSVSSSGVISAPATLVPGSYTVSGVDSDAFGDTGAWSFTLTVNPAGGSISVTNTSGSVNAPSSYTGQLAAAGNNGPVTYVTSSGNAFGVSSSGAISAGATMAPGTYTVSGTDTDAFGDTGSWSFSLTVNAGPNNAPTNPQTTPTLKPLVRPSVTVTQTKDVVSGKSTSVKVACKTAACHVTIKLTITETSKSVVHHKTVTVTKTVVLGSGSGKIAAGKSASIRVSLTAAGSAALAQAKGHQMAVTETATVTGGSTVVKKVTL